MGKKWRMTGFSYFRVGMSIEAKRSTGQHERRRWRIAFTVPTLMVLALWSLMGIEALSGGDWYWLGVYPRAAHGVVGIILMPFLHADWGHALGNSLPLILLGSGLFYFYPSRALWVMGIGWIGTGMGVWLMARGSYHIGASGLVYCIAAFVCISGIIRGQRTLAAVSLVVVLLYGSMVWGLLPSTPGVSWEGHAIGTFLGLLMAVLFHEDDRPLGEGIGDEAPYRYDGRTHTGAAKWRIRYRVQGENPNGKRGRLGEI